MTAAATKVVGHLEHSGMGGFLNPPTHPEHEWSVVNLPERARRDGEFAMSLSTAVESEWLSDQTRARAKDKLLGWVRPSIDLPEVQDWIRQVLGYFRNCYRGEGPEPQCWHAGNLQIVGDGRPMDLDLHAGVHLIREYYPAYQPETVHFQEAYETRMGARRGIFTQGLQREARLKV